MQLSRDVIFLSRQLPVAWHGRRIGEVGMRDDILFIIDSNISRLRALLAGSLSNQTRKTVEQILAEAEAERVLAIDMPYRG